MTFFSAQWPVVAMASTNGTTYMLLSIARINPAELVISGVYCVVVGLLGVVVNTLTVIAVSRTRKLHTPCFILLAAHSVGCWTMALGFLADGARRCGLFFDLYGFRLSRLVCCIIYIPKIMSVPTTSMFTCVIGLDRLYGIAFPILYQRHGRRFVLAAVASGAGIAVATVLIATSTAPGRATEMIQCYNFFSAYHPIFIEFYNDYHLALCILSVCIYGMILFLVKWRHWRATKTDATLYQRHPDEPTRSQQSRYVQSQLAILPMVEAVMTAYFFFGVCPGVIMSFLGQIEDGRLAPKSILYASMLKATGACADFFILASKSQEFKLALERLFFYGHEKKTESLARDRSDRRAGILDPNDVVSL